MLTWKDGHRNNKAIDGGEAGTQLSSGKRGSPALFKPHERELTRVEE